MSKKIKKKKNVNVVNEGQEVVDSPFKIYVERFKRNKLAMFGLYLTLAVVALIAISWIYVKVSGYDLSALNHADRNLPPSLKYPFGTDKDGRSYFIRVLYGGGYLTTSWFNCNRCCDTIRCCFLVVSQDTTVVQQTILLCDLQKWFLHYHYFH